MKNYIVNWKAYKLIDGKYEIVCLGDFSSRSYEEDSGNLMISWTNYVKTVMKVSFDYIQVEPFLV